MSNRFNTEMASPNPPVEAYHLYEVILSQGKIPWKEIGIKPGY
jgi:hypothetical protein